MEKKMLNVAWLNGATPMGNGGASGGGGVTINNQDKTVDIADNGTTKITADSGYTGLGTVTVNTNVKAGGGDTPSRPTYTGHADVEGLKSIGWTDEDIAYYQEHGVNWNEEDDEYHKVPEDNIALYGVLTASNISTYKDRIVYLPKIDTSSVTNMGHMFDYCYSLVSIPQLNTTNVTNMSNMFDYCHSLVSIPQLDTTNVKNMRYMFDYCFSLVSIPQLDTTNVKDMRYMFDYCYSLVSIPQLDTTNVKDMSYMFNDCYSLVSIPQLNTTNVTNMSNMFDHCYSLQTANIEGLKFALQVYQTSLLSKESLLYIINNEAATSAITIKLSSYCYDKYAEDADVVTALTNHPNISLAK